ncbi:polysaccharide lyase [Halomontanus rarus]|uniref:polysaccharide lyase n=1 Tax=Halomontanus rarus TaxID=3034020 RepID=UPI001F616FE5
MQRRVFLASVAGTTVLAGCSNGAVGPDEEEAADEIDAGEREDNETGPGPDYSEINESETDPDPDYGEVNGAEELLQTADQYDSISFEGNWAHLFRYVYEGSDTTTNTNWPNVPFRVRWPEGEYYGTTMDYFFKDHYDSEPEAGYVRTWMQFPDGWEFHSDGLGGTKLPGFASRFNGREEGERAGWGGRASDGTNGWSARMFNCRPDRHPEHAGPIALGSQIYHANAASEYGDHPRWSVPLETKTWHRIDQYVEVNTPGKPDGSYLGWVDGELAIGVDDLYMREKGYEDIKIESLWFNCYFGGDWKSPIEQHMHFDNLQLWLWDERPGVTAKK